MADVRQLDTIGTAEAAEILGWSRSKVKREAKNGGLPTIGKLPAATGAYLFNRDTIEYLADGNVIAVAS